MTFNVVALTEWEVLKAKFKLSMDVLHHLELCSSCSTYHSPAMDYTITECPEAMGDCQEMGHNSGSPRGSCVVRGDAGQMIVLKA